MKWIQGHEMVQRYSLSGFDLIKEVQSGLQPYDGNGRKLLPPGVGKVFKRYLELKLGEEGDEGIDSIEERFPRIQISDYSDWCTLNLNRQVNWDGKLVKIDFPDGSDSEIREKYETKKAELERLKLIVKQYPQIPLWIGYELPDSPKDVQEAINLLLDSYYKLDDVNELDIIKKNEGHVDNKVLIRKRLSQIIKEKAIAMAKEYVDKQQTKKKLPIIKEAVELIQKNLVQSKYKNDTIHDWIKEYFPDESRKKGRPKKNKNPR